MFTFIESSHFVGAGRRLIAMGDGIISDILRVALASAWLLRHPAFDPQGHHQRVGRKRHVKAGFAAPVVQVYGADRPRSPEQSARS